VVVRHHILYLDVRTAAVTNAQMQNHHLLTSLECPLRPQIPAFLCRQTDLIVAAAKTGAIIQIKKGQFCAASVMRNSAEKCRAAGKRCCFIIAPSVDDPVACFGVVMIRITKPSQAISAQTSARSRIPHSRAQV
jgi:DAHP synthetase I family